MEAFDFVSSGPPMQNEAHLSKETGATFWHSELGDNVEELPIDVGDGSKYVPIPHKSDLALGRDLAIGFAEAFLADDIGSVREIFSHRGAYARFKGLLERRGMLKRWHEFEASSQRAAVLEWCAANGIEIDGEQRVGADRGLSRGLSLRARLAYIASSVAGSTRSLAVIRMSAVKFREITAAEVPALFYVRTRTRENTMTLEELQRLGINPRSVTESLGKSTKGWVCDDFDRVVAFSMADRATGEFLVIAVLPEYEGKGVGGRLMALAEEWLAASGCKRAWLTTDLDTTLRAYGFYCKRGWTDWKIERGLRWMELSLPP